MILQKFLFRKKPHVDHECPGLLPGAWAPLAWAAGQAGRLGEHRHGEAPTPQLSSLSSVIVSLTLIFANSQYLFDSILPNDRYLQFDTLMMSQPTTSAQATQQETQQPEPSQLEGPENPFVLFCRDCRTILSDSMFLVFADQGLDSIMVSSTTSNLLQN